MLLRNAIIYTGGHLLTGPDVRFHNGRVQEIGYGLVNGLYEDPVDLQGDYLLPAPSLRPSRAEILQLLSEAAEQAAQGIPVENALRDCGLKEGGILPGTPGPLLRVSPEWVLKCLYR